MQYFCTKEKVLYIFKCDYEVSVDFLSNNIILISQNYLSRYGYIPPVFTDSTASNQLTKEIVSQGLWDLQDFFGLNRTGTKTKII